MKISLIGSGQVATHLGMALSKVFDIKQVLSQRLANAQLLADAVGAVATDNYQQLEPVDVYIVAVSDRTIEQVAQQLAPYAQHALVLHTSGSVAMDVLLAASDHVGVLYPLQTFSKGKMVDFSTVPFLLEVANEQDRMPLRQLAHALSARIYDYSSAQRRSLHLAAVMACNFSNYLYTVASDYLATAQVDFDLLKPLILETAEKVQHHAPQSVQTGPAVRGDQAVIHQHLEMLDNQPELQQLYALLSERIVQRHQG